MTRVAPKWLLEFSATRHKQASSSSFTHNPIMPPSQHKHSNSKQVYLNKLNLNSRGNYRCEVTAEAPSFTSVHSEAHMEVIYYNKEDPNPTIAGGEQTYEVGDLINLNCTSSQSYPAAELKWYINGNQVSGDAVIKYDQLETKQGFVSSNSGLRFIVEPQHVMGGRMTVRCTATVSANFWQTESQQSMLPQPGYWEKQLLVRGGAARNPSASVVMTLLLTSLATLAASALLWGDGGWT
ncbi:hypothetical protein B566_EDAN011148 [Ephemera danica]|nr:hypothetical protein B566_EDAN011148 [Ephemera danica]